MKGAAATVGLTTSLTMLRGGILVVSTSPRTGAASNLGFSPSSSRGEALCRILVNTVRVRGALVRARVTGLRVVPSRVGLIKIRFRVLGVRGERSMVGGTLAGVESGCSCVVVSYSPSLNLVAIGSLATTSSVVVPMRPRFFTLRNLKGLLRAVELIRGNPGPTLAVRNFLMAVFSKEAGIRGRILRRLGRRFKPVIFGAVVREGVELDRTPSRKGPVVLCSIVYGKAAGCLGLTGRMLRGG